MPSAAVIFAMQSLAMSSVTAHRPSLALKHRYKADAAVDEPAAQLDLFGFDAGLVQFRQDNSDEPVRVPLGRGLPLKATNFMRPPCR